ncbi:MAG: transporter substrate-binding domain-containing protein [Rhodospirillales bacterium]|nr:transporter substrate-binding domain-containing protein [Rhodospirillales bacterium]MDE2575832.1 transporter substrate-binding domain-containing protein [Rhodospirillales bacterium]
MTDPRITASRRKFLLGASALLAAPALLSTPVLAATLEDIKKRGEVVIGIQGDNPPWGYVAANGEQQGFDADIGRAFAKYLGVKVKFVPLAVVNRIPALTTGRVDVLFATMAMLPDRAKVVQFSLPYVANQMSVVAPKSEAIKAAADLAKYKVGVPRSSVQDSDISRIAPKGTDILRFNDDAATIQAMLSGQVQAIGANQFYIERLNAAKPGVFENKFNLTALFNGACTRLGDKEMNATVNKFIEKIRADGTLTAAYAKWMKVPVPQFPASVAGVPFTAN